MMKKIKSISVLGAGIMGSGIAHVSATAGFKTMLYDIGGEILRKAEKQIHTNLQKGMELNKVTQEQMDTALGHLVTTTSFDDAAEADFIIEAVPEKIELKIETFSKLDGSAPPHAFLPAILRRSASQKWRR